MRIRNRRGITMEDTFIGILIGCGIIFLAGGILLLIAFLVFGKYLTQKKKCTATAEGAVVGYTIPAYSKVLHYPIVEFTAEDGKKYRIKGPEYRMHSVIGGVRFKDFGKIGYKLLENEEKQTIHVRLGGPSDGSLYPLGKNPLKIKYPKGTTLPVYYDPAHPKRGYVKRYCDKRFMFWILSGTAIFCFVLAVFIFLMFYLFG